MIRIALSVGWRVQSPRCPRLIRFCDCLVTLSGWTILYKIFKLETRAPNEEKNALDWQGPCSIVSFPSVRCPASPLVAQGQARYHQRGVHCSAGVGFRPSTASPKKTVSPAESHPGQQETARTHLQHHLHLDTDLLYHSSLPVLPGMSHSDANERLPSRSLPTCKDGHPR